MRSLSAAATAETAAMVLMVATAEMPIKGQLRNILLGMAAQEDRVVTVVPAGLAERADVLSCQAMLF